MRIEFTFVEYLGWYVAYVVKIAEYIHFQNSETVSCLQKDVGSSFTLTPHLYPPTSKDSESTLTRTLKPCDACRKRKHLE